MLLAALGGCCGGKPTYDTVPVTGTVKYNDGTVPQGEVANIQFVPGDLGPSPVSQGRIVAYGLEQ